MSHLHRQDVTLQERDEQSDRARSPFSDVAGRFASWVAGADRLAEDAPGDEESFGSDPLRALTARAEDADPPAPSRFPVAPLGYNRAAVDEHLAELERELADLGRELAELRAQRDAEAPPSVTEELERIGEQTASILVVAHDKASETTRRAQEEAERCIADAAANAVAMTEAAKRKLRELDEETDAVWRERERLLEDMRAVSKALASLADQASDRFPAAPDQGATAAFPVAAAPRWRGPDNEPQATVSFTAAEEAEALSQAGYDEDAIDAAPAVGPVDEPADDGFEGGDPGDTASWLAGFEPPEDLHRP